jgi:hypothetical protein
MEIRRIMIQGQPNQKVPKIPSKLLKTGHGGAHMSSYLCRRYKQEDSGPGLWVKNNQSKKTTDVVQVVEHLL